jgi:hypothetical protein
LGTGGTVVDVTAIVEVVGAVVDEGGTLVVAGVGLARGDAGVLAVLELSLAQPAARAAIPSAPDSRNFRRVIVVRRTMRNLAVNTRGVPRPH